MRESSFSGASLGEGRVDLVQLLGGELEVLVDRRLKVVLHVEDHVSDRLALHDLLSNVMDAAEVLLEVCRLIHLDDLANFGADIYQELGDHHDEVNRRRRQTRWWRLRQDRG